MELPESNPFIVIGGVVKRLEDEVSSAVFSKRDVIVSFSVTGNDGNNYNHDLKFSAINWMVKEVNELKEGDKVAIEAQVIGRDRHKNGKTICFQDLKILNLKKLNDE